jgi:hypothetical protein
MLDATETPADIHVEAASLALFHICEAKVERKLKEEISEEAFKEYIRCKKVNIHKTGVVFYLREEAPLSEQEAQNTKARRNALKQLYRLYRNEAVSRAHDASRSHTRHPTRASPFKWELFEANLIRYPEAFYQEWAALAEELENKRLARKLPKLRPEDFQ